MMFKHIKGLEHVKDLPVISPALLTAIFDIHTYVDVNHGILICPEKRRKEGVNIKLVKVEGGSMCPNCGETFYKKDRYSEIKRRN